MNLYQAQKGSTLLISMIMLVVLTLLVVFSLKSGNTNLRIAGNMQTQAEASAATQEAIEKVIEQIKVTDDLSLIAAQTVTVTTGPATYNVQVQAMNTCLVEVPILNSTLDPTKANDVACFEGTDGDNAIKADGTLVSKPSACKQQQWDIQASVTDASTGATASQVQGISIRVPSTVNCT
jgi:Tfp pilus assembly protein PilX